MSAVAIEDCWNRIGVRGDRSCERLESHVHCRNCPVYSAGAKRLLDKPASADSLSAAAAHFAAPARVLQAGTQSVAIFRVGLEWIAIPTAACLEFASVRPVHSLPHRRNGAVLGLTNIRGELLVCVSLAAILGLAGGQGAAKRFLVARGEGAAVVFPVDEVHGVHRFQPREAQEVPATIAKAQATYTRGILPLDGKSVGLIDAELLFYTVDRSLA